MLDFKSLCQILVCPSCHKSIVETENGFKCTQCNSFSSINRYGFIEARAGEADETVYEVDTTTEEYAEVQEFSGVRLYNEFLKPLLFQEPFRRVLDAGCSIGKGVCELVKDGYEAYGIDLPSLSKFWAQLGNDPLHFICCDVTQLPFPNDFFDVVYSLGVIEHIGTKIGHYTLSDNYWEVRQRYANELLRVTKPSGRIIVACPNKLFPIDIQHGPTDALSPESKFRSYVFEKMGINIHPMWGKYYLLSYSETKRLFCDNGGAHSFEALSLKGYFGFAGFEDGFLRLFKRFAAMYINHIPSFLRTSFLNPYMLAQIRK